MRILAVDTSLGACSAALLENGEVLAHCFVPMERGHAEALGPMVAKIVDGCEFSSLDRLAVTTGPGTFTGQRVGLAFMRGLRLALNVPLIGITSLAAMAEQARSEFGTAHAAALHHAKRGEVYFEMDEGPVLLAFEDAVTTLRGARGTIALAGTAAPQAMEAMNEGFLLSAVRQPDASWVAKLAAQAPALDASPKPIYLRAPDARLPSAP